MRAGLSTIQQTLTLEAASILNHSIAEAGRRNHGQTTPLHVEAALLASPSGFLRQACIKELGDLIESKELGEGPFSNVHVIFLEKELPSDRAQIPAKIKELGDLIETRMGNSSSGSVLVHLGNLKWLVEQSVNFGVSGLSNMQQQALTEAGRASVLEMGRLVTKFGEGASGRLWLLGTATCETYLRHISELDIQNNSAQKVWQVVEFIFGWIYVIEMALKVYSYGFENYWRDGQNQFDFIITLVIVIGETVTFVTPDDPDLFSNGEWYVLFNSENVHVLMLKQAMIRLRVIAKK
ncbi:hypothetical protein K1719_009250 [Acacia pycnantha]|nr:hypothetical protein K1719_009250 [Acacia pycnantha]